MSEYVRVMCIRCPKALPEGLSGPSSPHPHPQTPAGVPNRGHLSTFKHAHCVETADIVTVCYQSLLSRGFDPQGLGGGEG